MAIGTPTALGQNSTSTAATTLVITTTVAAPAGALIFLEISNHNNVVPTSVTDSAGNSYTLVSASNGTTVTATLAYALDVAALPSGGTITITWPSARNAAAAAYAVDGIATTGAADQQATNTTGSSASPSVGPTGTTTQADELVVGVFGYSSSRTFTAGAGYTALATVESTGTIRGICGEYKIVAATGAQTADGTFNSSATYAGVLVTFKAASATALAASGTIAMTGAAALTFPLSASGTLTITGAAALTCPAFTASGTLAITGAAALSASFPATAGTLALSGAAALTVTGGTAALAASGTIAMTGAAALTFPLSASGTLALTGAASLTCPALTASGAIAITGAAVLSTSFPATAGAIAFTGAAALSVSGGLTQLTASGTIRLTGSAASTASGGPVALTASGTIRLTGSVALTPVTGGTWFSLMSAGPSAGWHWTRFKRPLLDRYLNITIAASGGTGYLGVSKDGATYTWFSGPLLADGRTLTQVADEAAARAAAIALPASGVWSLPATAEARVFKLGHKASLGGYVLYEFYPRRLVEADDIRAESIQAIHIAAGSITGDRLFATAIDGFVITGATIQTAATGARVVLSSAAQGGFIGYGTGDTYDPTTGIGTYQVRWSKADGKLYAGAGAVKIDSVGLTIAVPTTAGNVGGIKYFDGAAAVTEIGSYKVSATDYWAYMSSIDTVTLSVRPSGLNTVTTADVVVRLLQGAGITPGSVNVSGFLYTDNQVRITRDDGNNAATSRPAQLVIRSDTNNLVRLEIGVDTTAKKAVIGILEEGVAWKDIIIANNGGNVGIGSFSPSEKLAVAGNINVSGVYKVAGAQVLTTQRTGWGTPTGTLYRTALTNASTQTQFNQTIMAIVTDLKTHGLFAT